MPVYPASMEIERPPRFERIHVGIRVVGILLLATLGLPLGMVFGVLYLALPLVAAGASSQRGGARYLAELGPRLVRVIEWLLALLAYLLFTTDRLPSLAGAGRSPSGEAAPTPAVRYRVSMNGSPTAGSALLRLLTSLPAAVVVWLLGFVSAILWLVSLVTVLVSRSVPGPVLEFQRGMVRWTARLAAYHASLVEEYPPFTLGTTERGPVEATPA